MTVKEAYDIALQHEPDKKAICCLELKNGYAFNLVPKNDEMFANGSSFCVNSETKEAGWVVCPDVINIGIIREIDISELNGGPDNNGPSVLTK